MMVTRYPVKFLWIRLSEWMGGSRETRADLLRLDFNEDQNSNIIMNVKVVESKFRDTFEGKKPKSKQGLQWDSLI